jgi:hypothetical protein
MSNFHSISINTNRARSYVPKGSFKIDDDDDDDNDASSAPTLDTLSLSDSRCR